MIRTIVTRRMLVALIMGFSCGLPLLLTLSVLQAWMKEEGIDLAVIGVMALVGLPYTLKFFWAPFLDRYRLPILGRRRGWLIVAQIALALCIGALGFASPALHPLGLAAMALLVAFFSASQDIVVDAYRREDFSNQELGFASSLYIYGYRLGMLLSGGGGLVLAEYYTFRTVYVIMAACMLPGILTTLFAHEPDVRVRIPQSLKEAVIEPLTEYFSRQGAIWILAFILMYKIGDTMASAMTIPFYLDLGFSKMEIGAVVKLFGSWATVVGALVGGIIMIRLGISRSLWVFGVLQAVSTGCFVLLARVGHNMPALSGVIAFENLSGGMGTAAFAAFMASITDKRFTATQYALLSSLMGVPRVIVSAPTGLLAKYFGWENFFFICTFIAVPGLMILLKFAPWNGQEAMVTQKVYHE